MGAKWNSINAIVFVVIMVMAMVNVNGETLAQCHEDCIQGCATTGALPSKCLQNCYRGCHGRSLRWKRRHITEEMMN
ncbi:uncharacterized protein LOC111828624 [Capsella rubella]|uniref:uncharacterized protein LOC111828624 n=1 Tax=Capsella rubella TaxID=81985 RepID=UPI000CD54158|nr:uncharacterized protein LOC111828624 [Capsella rubella]